MISGISEKISSYITIPSFSHLSNSASKISSSFFSKQNPAIWGIGYGLAMGITTTCLEIIYSKVSSPENDKKNLEEQKHVFKLGYVSIAASITIIMVVFRWVFQERIFVPLISKVLKEQVIFKLGKVSFSNIEIVTALFFASIVEFFDRYANNTLVKIVNYHLEMIDVLFFCKNGLSAAVIASVISQLVKYKILSIYRNEKIGFFSR
ncbi:MAG: hypothetical protein L0207_04735 [Chlamydiae bacterium]|nr:hypothetical protein [Chlamydiota bacterium]